MLIKSSLTKVHLSDAKNYIEFLAATQINKNNIMELQRTVYFLYGLLSQLEFDFKVEAHNEVKPTS